jgi:hypothetical protein
MKCLRLLASLLFGLLASCSSLPQSAFAQAATPTWFSASPQQIVDGSSVTFTTPATVRYGQDASTCIATFLTCVNGQPSLAAWLPPVTITATAAAPVTIVVGTDWAGSDPNPGVRKQLQIGEAAASQTATVVNPSGVSSTVIVPALPPSPTVYSPTYRAGTFYPAKFSNISVITGNPAAPLLETFNIPPYMFVAGVLENFNMTFSVGVVPFTCTYGGVMVSPTGAGTISMTCSPMQK